MTKKESVNLWWFFWMRSLVMFCALVCLGMVPQTGWSQEDGVYPSGNGLIIPIINVEDSRYNTYVLSLLNVFQIMNRQPIVVYNNETNPDFVNFYYASGEGFIENRRVTNDAIDYFGNEISSRISELNTNTDVCYVQDFRISNDQRVTVGIHNEDNDYSEDTYRCLTVALWQYKYGNTEGFDGINWQISFTTLIEQGDE